MRNSRAQSGPHPPGWVASCNLKHNNYKAVAPAYAIINSLSEHPHACILHKTNNSNRLMLFPPPRNHFPRLGSQSAPLRSREYLPNLSKFYPNFSNLDKDFFNNLLNFGKNLFRAVARCDEQPCPGHCASRGGFNSTHRVDDCTRASAIPKLDPKWRPPKNISQPLG